MPIAYALINKLTGKQKAELTSQIIKAIFYRGKGRVKVITLDGDPAHIKMIEELGGKFKICDVKNDKVQSLIKIDGLDWDILAMLDLNHMLKLVQNALESKQSFVINRRITDIFNQNQLEELLEKYCTSRVLNFLSTDGTTTRRVEWNFLTALHRIQEKTGIRLENKITRHHVNFRSKIMNVRLCAQTLHDDTANSFLKCEFEQNFSNFKSSIYTAIFFKIFHRVFKILTQ